MIYWNVRGNGLLISTRTLEYYLFTKKKSIILGIVATIRTGIEKQITWWLTSTHTCASYQNINKHQPDTTLWLQSELYNVFHHLINWHSPFRFYNNVAFECFHSFVLFLQQSRRFIFNMQICKHYFNVFILIFE